MTTLEAQLSETARKYFMAKLPAEVAQEFEVVDKTIGFFRPRDVADGDDGEPSRKRQRIAELQQEEQKVWSAVESARVLQQQLEQKIREKREELEALTREADAAAAKTLSELQNSRVAPRIVESRAEVKAKNTRCTKIYKRNYGGHRPGERCHEPTHAGTDWCQSHMR